MSESLTILIDMDGVLADFDREVLNRIREQYPYIPILSERSNFYISEDYPEHKELVKEVSDQPGFFNSLPLVDFALEGWQRIIDLGYNPRICSSPISSNPNSEQEKLSWIERHFVPVFGGYVVEQAIITKDKHLHEGRALIDDRPEVRNSNEANWEHIVFDQPYNKHINGPRLINWQDNNLAALLDTI